MVDALLELETRRRIYETVVHYPGLHLREVARQTGYQLGLVEYHLTQLLRHELVYEIADGEYRRYYPRDPLGVGERRDVLSAEEKRTVALLRQRVPLEIILLLLHRGPATHKELLAEVSVGASTLTHHLRKLLERAVVVRREDRAFQLADAKGLHLLLLKFRPHPGTLSEGFAQIWEELAL